MRNKNAKVCDPNSFVTCPGCDEHILYSAKILPTGEIRLIPSGKESISEKINAEKHFTDISYIVSRLQMGDTSVLRDGAMYGDFTKVPKTLAESLQLVIDGQRKFDQLPLEVKNKFNNSYYAWISSSGSKEWLDAMGFAPAQKEDVKEEVKSNES